MVSVILVCLCIRNIDFEQSISLLMNANIRLIVLGLFIYISSYIVRSYRWDCILAPLKKMKLFQSFFYLVFGFFMNNILPLRLGEFVRAIVAGNKLCISRSGVFATIVVERLMDVIIFIISFFLIAIFVSNIPHWLQKIFIACALIFGIIFIALFFISKNENKFLNFLYKIQLSIKLKELVKTIFLKFASGLKFFQNKLFLAFGLHVSIIQCLFVIVTTGIATMLPTAPGFIGAIEGVGMVTLQIFSIEETVAFTSMVAIHFTEMMAIYILGFIGMIKEKISFLDLFNFALKQKQEAQEQNGK